MRINLADKRTKPYLIGLSGCVLMLCAILSLPAGGEPAPQWVEFYLVPLLITAVAVVWDVHKVQARNDGEPFFKTERSKWLYGAGILSAYIAVAAGMCLTAPLMMQLDAWLNR